MLANEETIKAIVEDVKKFVSGIVDTLTSSINSKLDKTGGDMTGDITRLDESSNSYNLSSGGIEFASGQSSESTKLHSSGVLRTKQQNEYNYSFPDKSGTFAMQEDLPDLEDYLTKDGGELNYGKSLVAKTKLQTGQGRYIYKYGTLAPDGLESRSEAFGSILKNKLTPNGFEHSNPAGSYTNTLPNKSGELALLGDIPSPPDISKKVNSDIEGMMINWHGQISTADWFLAWDPADGTGKTIHAISNSNIKNVLGLDGLYTAGTNPTCGNGEAITQPGGDAVISLRTTTGTSKDAGIFYLSQDNAYIANSSDNCYAFGVFDTDLTTNMYNPDNASFVVLPNGEGCKIRGNNVLHTGSWTLVASTTGQNEVNFSTTSYGEFLVKFRVPTYWTLSVLIPKVSMLTTGSYEWWYSGSYKSGDGETTGGTIRTYHNGTGAWFYLDGMFVAGVNKSSECSVYIYAR